MYTLIVTIQIKPEHRDSFIEAMLEDARISLRNEQGVVRFDMHQDEEDPNRFYMYEVFRDKNTFESHLQTAQVKTLRETTKTWYAAPSVIQRGFNLFPTDSSWT